MGRKIKYGKVWDSDMHDDLFIELYMFLHSDADEVEKRRVFDMIEGIKEDERDVSGLNHDKLPVVQVGDRLSKFDHFWKAVDLLWNKNELSPRKVIRNGWTDKMSWGMIYYTYASLAGSGSCGKSDIMAVYGIVKYLASPFDTKIILTSTTLSAAQLRVWRSVSELWLDSFPGKMVASKCLIRGINKKGKLSEETGLKLIAAGGTADDDFDQAFIGIKQDRIVALFDELTDLTHGVLNAALLNLDTTRNFECKAASNPDTFMDPFARLSKPKDGWKAVSEDDYMWETDRGVCLRFDAEKSPNYDAGYRKYAWLPSKESIDNAKLEFGEHSRLFYRMYKAFWFQGGKDDAIYSEGDFIYNDGNVALSDDEIDKNFEPILLAGADPSYTHGGDLFPVTIGRIVSIKGKRILEVVAVEVIKDDTTSEAPNRTYHSVSCMRALADEYGIDPANFGFDITGAGIPFRDVLVSEWSSLPLGVNFGGGASSRRVSVIDSRPASEVYGNRATELWVRMKGLLREGRIRGVPDEIVAEICNRKWAKKMLSSGKLRIESKIDMKKRGLRSPDKSDSLFILLEVAVSRGYLDELETEAYDSRMQSPWDEMQQELEAYDQEGLFLEYD